LTGVEPGAAEIARGGTNTDAEFDGVANDCAGSGKFIRGTGDTWTLVGAKPFAEATELLLVRAAGALFWLLAGFG
jgi:hypothetical protein